LHEIPRDERGRRPVTVGSEAGGTWPRDGGVVIGGSINLIAGLLRENVRSAVHDG
jgi:hypothetical protein